MSVVNPEVSITVEGLQLRLKLSYAAIITLKEKYNLSIVELGGMKPEEFLLVLPKLVFAFTRTMESPPSEEELFSLGLDVTPVLLAAVSQAMANGQDAGGLGKGRPGTMPEGAGLSGQSGKRSRSARRTSGSRSSRS